MAENKVLEIEVSGDGKSLPEGWEVLVNHVSVDAVLRRGRKPIYRFEIGYYAGTLNVAVAEGTKIRAVVDLDADPALAKLSRDEYAGMVSEIAKFTLALYKLGNVTLVAQGAYTGARSDLVTLELVRSYFEIFERSATRIANQPVRALRSTTGLVSIRNARQIDDRAICEALRSRRSRAATVAEMRAAPRLISALGGRWVDQFMESRREEKLDIYENRAVLGFIQWLIVSMGDMVERLSVGHEEFSAAAAAVWRERLVRWRARLSAPRRRGVFADLPPDSVLRASSVFRMHPDYASAFAAMVKMKAGLGSGAAIAPSVPIDCTYTLYELWCYVGLLHAAVEMFPFCLPRATEILRGCSKPNRLGVQLGQGGATELPLGDGLTLTYQRRFSRRPAEDGSCTLVLEAAVPDVTLAKVDAKGVCKGLVVFNPKYRIGSSLLDGLRDLHVYRDAIVDSDGKRLVKAAVALSPRPGAIGAPEDAEIRLDVPSVVAARPGHDPQLFQRTLRSALAILS